VFLQQLKEGVEKASLDYARDWFEAVNFAFSDVPSHFTLPSGVEYFDPIAAYVLERLEQVVLVPTAQSTAASAVAQDGSGDSQQGADSFANQSKVLSLVCALVRAAQEASYVHGQAQGSGADTHSRFGDDVVQLLLSYAGTGLVSSYRSTRNDLAYLLHLLTETHATGRPEGVVQICAKLARACEGSASATVVPDDATPEERANAAVAATPGQVLGFKNAAETVCLLLRCGVHNIPAWRFHGIWRGLFAAALIGAGSSTSSAIEAAKMCHDTCLLVCNATVRARQPSAEPDLVNQLLTYILSTAQEKTTPLHSRETLMKCASLLMANNWYALTGDERKVRFATVGLYTITTVMFGASHCVQVCRDIFSLGLDDPKPEVQRLAQAGMVAYLALFKTTAELAAIAAVYAKNSDILVAR
jgi:hypothetical protein